MWFIGVEVEQETSAPPPKKNPGSAPELPIHEWKSHWNLFPVIKYLLLTYSTISSGIWLTYIVYNQEP